MTGGCGYIGSHTVWALHDRGDQIVVVDDLSTGIRENLPPDVSLCVTDVGDHDRVGQVIRMHKPDAIIHFAGKILPAESLASPLRYFDVNTAKSIALLQSAIAGDVRFFIFSSTAAVYAPSSGPVVTEQSPTAPLTPYGRSKLMVEDVLRATTAAHSFSATALRYFNVAGVDPDRRCGPAGENPGHLIRTAVEVATGKREKLGIFGDDYGTPDGTCVRDYIHVSDLAAAHIVALDALAGGAPCEFSVLNCGYGKGASVLEVIAAFERVLDRKLPHATVERRAGDAPALVADATLLRALGWTPHHDALEDIIISALGWAGASPH